MMHPASVQGLGRFSIAFSDTPAAVYRRDPKKIISSDCTVVRKIPSGGRVHRHLLW